eukprot:scaffold7337_cov106-Skeletonema_marinoi.AAC.2
MADDDEMIFVYTGGDQIVPMDVRRVRIDESVKIIPEDAFKHRQHLIDVEFHDEIEEIGAGALYGCYSLMGSIKLLGVKVIENWAFYDCFGLTDVEFGGQLEMIGGRAFGFCQSLRSVTIPSAGIIEGWAFENCEELTDLDLPEGLETIQERAFHNCHGLRRISIPLKDGMIEDDAFYQCPILNIDIVGGIHSTTASLLIASGEMEK